MIFFTDIQFEVNETEGQSFKGIFFLVLTT